MQRITTFTCFVIVFFSSCNTKIKNFQSVLTPNNIKSSFISLNADAAYTLKTPKGAVIKIAKKTFKVNPNNKVELEIKEVYTLQDIVLAGLTTESNGKALKSAGMIYINATSNGKTIELQQPIKISIPAEDYDDNMQLFKGETNEDSTINWIDPQPLDTGLTARKLLLGERLFKNCAGCHKPTKDFTGPPLAGCRERSPDKDWPYRFTRNPALMITRGDAYASQLYRKWKGSGLMTSFPNLTREEVNAILDYVDNQALLNPESVEPKSDSPVADTSKHSIPCGFDTIYYAKPDTSIMIIPAEETSLEPAISNNNTIETDLTTNAPLNFTDRSTSSGMYDIAIDAFGWYNLDVFITAYNGLTDVTVKVQLQLPIESAMNVFLFCPDKKLLTEASYKEGNHFLFEQSNGKVPLFLKDKAIILAFGSKADKMFYGTASFNVKTEQTIIIKIKETTGAELKSFIQKNNIDGIKIDLNKKNDFEIKEKPCDEVYPLKVSKQ